MAQNTAINPTDNEISDFISSVCDLLHEVNSETQNISENVDRCEFFANRLLAAMKHTFDIVLYCQANPTRFDHGTLEDMKSLREKLKLLYQTLQSLPAMGNYAYCPPVRRDGTVGRPQFEISAEQLQCLRNEFNSWSAIARDLGVSRQTIYNRRRNLNFSLNFESYTQIGNDQLDVMVRQELSEFPRTGETNLMGGLRRRGVFIQRWRMRESIVRVDPIGRANRWAQRIVRRPYSVPHPNFLWHIDTNAKLIHWKFCIHGCTDGFSRCVIYLKASTNNRATTVLGYFQGATTEWGHPSRVRADDGGENVAVGEYITWFRGANRGSFITGPSTRNTRIERLWRDVGESVIPIYKQIFVYMEMQSLLDTSKELDMFSLHYVFLPRIQRSLDSFKDRYNHHSLSTERNRSPRQLWAAGCLQNFTSSSAGVRDVFDSNIPENLQHYGDDPNAPMPSMDSEGVSFPPINFIISDGSFQALKNSFSPLEDDGNYGINIFLQVKDYLTQIILLGSNGQQPPANAVLPSN